MAKNKMLCPICSTKLKMTDGRMTCKSCGYYIRNESEQESTGGAAVQTQVRLSAISPISVVNKDALTNKIASAPPKAEGKKNLSLIIVPIIIVAVSLCVGGFALAYLYFSFNHMLDSQRAESENSRVSQSEEEESGYGRGREESIQSSFSGRTQPESSFFQEMASLVWGKDYELITAEEYSHLTALQINSGDQEIYYQLDHGETQMLVYGNDYGREWDDLSVFSGLEWLSIDDYLFGDELMGLNKLYAVYTENSIEDYLKMIPHPENITELGIENFGIDQSLEGIDSFPNLRCLSVDYYDLVDISALSKLPDLQMLTLIDCDDLMDYSPLMTLTKLESLSIESTQLKSIDFVEKMPVLTSLNLEDSEVRNIDALVYCPELSMLSLIRNYEIEDYSVIGQLTKLQALGLETASDSVLPSFENLLQLQTVELKNINDLTPLGDAAGITSLRLERCSGWQMEVIGSLQELETLTLNDFSTHVTSLEPLTNLPKLTTLKLENENLGGDIEALFGIPTLCCLYVEDCRVGINFDSIPVNESLELLSLSGTSIVFGPEYNNWETIALSEHYDMFDKFPNLTELFLASQAIDSIEFVENLPKLQYLDITDNNVTSLKPLEALSDFQTVWCGSNTILEWVSESSGIRVSTSDDFR